MRGEKTSPKIMQAWIMRKKTTIGDRESLWENERVVKKKIIKKIEERGPKQTKAKTKKVKKITI